MVEIEASSAGSSEIPEDYYNAFLGVAAEAAASAAKAESQADRAEAAAGSIDTSNLCSKTMYDPDGAVENAGGIPKYVAANAPQGDFIPASQKNAANGVAPLDGDKKVPAANLPTSDAISSSSSETVATSKAVKSAYDRAVEATGIIAAIGNTITKTAYIDSTAYSARLTISPTKYGRLVIANCIFEIEAGLGKNYSFSGALASYKPFASFTTYAGPIYQTKGTFNSHYNASVSTDGSVEMVVAAMDGGENPGASYNNARFTLVYIATS